MKYITTRWGEIDIKETEVLNFPKGILGFSQLTRYGILERKEFAPFKWIQSLEDPNVAFVILDPVQLFPNFKLEINEKELEELNYTNSRDLMVYVIVNIPHDVSLSSADLLGPLVINQKNRLGKQAVMPESPYTTKHYLLDELRKRERRKQFDRKKASV
jgi:flagellar assembly factor FliW